jgi:ubiquinone/menaquinone biosynthesis C-methylase UbiE
MIQRGGDAETISYDHLAAGFDHRRPLADGVPAAIRAAILAELTAQPRVLDLGCGAGRIGWPFVAAGDDYTAVDVSLDMLKAFAARGLARPALRAQADGAHLPFPDATFDAVLLVQVLSGVTGWRGLLGETRRVLRSAGVLFVGRSKAPGNGLDAGMKQRLSELLDDMGQRPYQRQSNEDAYGWLERHAERTTREVARWPMVRSPRQFMERHGAAVRFSTLDNSVKTIAMSRLADWALAKFGSLDAESAEIQLFELDMYRFHQKAMP